MIDRRHLIRLGAGALTTLAFSQGKATSQNQGRPKKRLRVIDTHMHVFNTDLEGKNGVPKYYLYPSTIERTLELMDRGGVDKGFLLSYNAEDTAQLIRYRGDRPAMMNGDPVRLKPVLNKKYQLRAWKAHRDRFWWFTGHVRPLHEEYLEDLERDFEIGASGVKLLPLIQGLLPDHPAWFPIYDLCRKWRKPVIMDLSWWLIGQEVAYGLNESRVRQNMIRSFKSFDDYAHLIDRIFKEYPAVPFSLAHCGTAKAKEDYDSIFRLIARHPNLSCDLAAIMDFSPRFIRSLVNAVGVQKIMYGTDSHTWTKDIDSYLRGSFRWSIIAEDCDFLNNQEKQLILAANAERFVRNELPPSGG